MLHQEHFRNYNGAIGLSIQNCCIGMITSFMKTHPQMSLTIYDSSNESKHSQPQFKHE